MVFFLLSTLNNLAYRKMFQTNFYRQIGFKISWLISKLFLGMFLYLHTLYICIFYLISSNFSLDDILINTKENSIDNLR